MHCFGKGREGGRGEERRDRELFPFLPLHTSSSTPFLAPFQPPSPLPALPLPPPTAPHATTTHRILETELKHSGAVRSVEVVRFTLYLLWINKFAIVGDLKGVLKLHWFYLGWFSLVGKASIGQLYLYITRKGLLSCGKYVCMCVCVCVLVIFFFLWT